MFKLKMDQTYRADIGDKERGVETTTMAEGE